MQKNTGDRLKEERERIKLTQEEFGKLGGVKKLTQFKYEKGERAPDANYLVLLIEAEVDVTYILTGHRSPSISNESISREEMVIIDHYRNMDEDAQKNMQAVSAAFAAGKPKKKVKNG